MEDGKYEISVDEFSDELWEQMMSMKAKVAPDWSLDDWVSWLVKKGIEIYKNKERK